MTSLSYSHPTKRIARRALRLKPCPCGCNFVTVGWRRYRRSAASASAGTALLDWGDLGRVGKWATRDPDGD